MSRNNVSIIEIRKAVVACRTELRLGLEYASIGDITKAYGHFEKAQDHAFRAKELTNIKKYYNLYY